VFRAQADWTFILPSELPTKELRHLPRKMRGGIFLGKWRGSFVGSSDGKINVQSACALNTLYKPVSTIDQYQEYYVLGYITV
jgi:hypothetical protein